MGSRAYKQDMPPEGGYAPVNFKRIPARTLISGKWLFAGLVGYHIAGYAYYTFCKRPEVRAVKTEANGFRLALQPLMLAERDRMFIQQCKVLSNMPNFPVFLHNFPLLFISGGSAQTDFHIFLDVEL